MLFFHAIFFKKIKLIVWKCFNIFWKMYPKKSLIESFFLVKATSFAQHISLKNMQ